ncbi:aldose 1-epimerase family protein [Fructobacillus parabroussonetiae]|uniref:Aldose 1-epimerase family protein n=1 Tax=Fructobacillus parabroussonetiae TaxID=2713174 RepID=A0ABS5QWZ4_9LACO|nr:aldose 1-epimerase family protein [Fructobacillus parabroussonetiae]MBS9337462.1 aldose 1-epimerase family protein [Fructobacillus parabroussonetiae]MCK8616990.1 aldose 1-epimerase family protein [Fructobacillus parabroussonetiae]
MITLENDQLIVKINQHGAELVSAFNKEANLEYIWYGDPMYWGRHAPNLFPIVGRLQGDQYTLAGQTYYMNQHGFARNMDFDIVKQDADYVRFSLTDSEATWRIYPFSFQFDVIFKLVGTELFVDYEVHNPDKQKSLFFSVGGHPAFNLPLDGGKFSDYYLSVKPEKIYDRIRLVGPYSNPNMPSPFNADIPLRLRQEDYHDDAIILKLDRQKTTFLLARLANQHGMEMTVDNAQYLGIWTPAGKDAPFIAVEPWWGIADTVDATGNFKEKFGNNVLAAGDTFNGSYSMNFF